MTYDLILFLTRSHSLTSEQFRDHYESVHIPLAYSLLAPCWPVEFKRRYLARITRKGFGSPANRDHPPLMLRGVVNDSFDCDCISEMMFEDEAHFREFYRSVYAKETAALLTRDEANFLQDGTTRIMVIGETWSTDRAGRTSRDVSVGLMSERLESEESGSSQS